MLRIFCSTGRCDLQAAQLLHAQQREAALRGQVETLRAERDAAVAQIRALSDALREANASTEFYLDLFCAERERHAVTSARQCPAGAKIRG